MLFNVCAFISRQTNEYTNKLNQYSYEKVIIINITNTCNYFMQHA